MSEQPLFGGIELGGTKCICLIGRGPDDIRARRLIPTGSNSDDTLRRIETTLLDWKTAHGQIAALGIASFGPLNLTIESPRYGYITSTTKPGWRDTDIAHRLSKIFSVPVGFDTDVNGAALAEARWGGARNINDFAYVTVGTGVGVGLFVNGSAAQGFNHPELGHIRVARKPGDIWKGSCSYHGDCIEGLASGPAIAARAGIPPEQVSHDNPLWELVAHSLGQLLHTLVLATAPRRILMGGGVMESRPTLLAAVRRELVESLNGYLDLEMLPGGLTGYVMAPELGSLSGALGALALAANAIS